MTYDNWATTDPGEHCWSAAQAIVDKLNDAEQAKLYSKLHDGNTRNSAVSAAEIYDWLVTYYFDQRIN